MKWSLSFKGARQNYGNVQRISWNIFFQARAGFWMTILYSVCLLKQLLVTNGCLNYGYGNTPRCMDLTVEKSIPNLLKWDFYQLAWMEGHTWTLRWTIPSVRHSPERKVNKFRPSCTIITFQQLMGNKKCGNWPTSALLVYSSSDATVWGNLSPSRIHWTESLSSWNGAHLQNSGRRNKSEFARQKCRHKLFMRIMISSSKIPIQIFLTAEYWCSCMRTSNGCPMTITVDERAVWYLSADRARAASALSVRINAAKELLYHAQMASE